MTDRRQFGIKAILVATLATTVPLMMIAAGDDLREPGIGLLILAYLYLVYYFGGHWLQ